MGVTFWVDYEWLKRLYGCDGGPWTIVLNPDTELGLAVSVLLTALIYFPLVSRPPPDSSW